MPFRAQTFDSDNLRWITLRRPFSIAWIFVSRKPIQINQTEADNNKTPKTKLRQLPPQWFRITYIVTDCTARTQICAYVKWIRRYEMTPRRKLLYLQKCFSFFGVIFGSDARENPATTHHNYINFTQATRIKLSFSRKHNN